MFRSLALALFSLLLPSMAFAQEHYESIAKPWQLNFQPPATPVMEQLVRGHNYLLVLITLISLFVLAVMIYIAIKFNRKANPVPSKTAHNTKLEIIWTVIPIFILVAIAIPSLRLHYFMQDNSDADMTLKVVGYQWYWHYDYPDQGGFGFDSIMKKENELAPGEHRLLAVDNHVVVPVDAKVHVLMTGADVIHSWAMPAFGVKRDAVPGRLNESWFKATKIGTFYGQCSELCGVGHGFMPIVVDVVSKEDFAAWVAKKQKEAGIAAPVVADSQKGAAPQIAPVSAEHANPDATIAKEKSMTKPGATVSNPGQSSDTSHVGNQNQPKPAKAAEESKQ